MLTEGEEQLTFSRAEIGARQQGLDILESRLGDEEIELRSTLSAEIDVDLLDAISELTARQASFQASLKTASIISQLTLIDFL
jgi:flagellar hook-associated protein 3 FlgL